MTFTCPYFLPEVMVKGSFSNDDGNGKKNVT